MCLSYVSVGIIALGEPEYETGRCLMLPEFALLLSPVEPLPVELVAGGEGRPEGETAPGLSGGSGRSGMLASLGSLGGNDPRNIADKGRLEEGTSERGGIRVGAVDHQPRRARKKEDLVVVVVVNSEQEVATTSCCQMKEECVPWEFNTCLREHALHFAEFRLRTEKQKSLVVKKTEPKHGPPIIFKHQISKEKGALVWPQKRPSQAASFFRRTVFYDCRLGLHDSLRRSSTP